MRSFIPAKLGSVWMAVDARQVQEIVGARPWVPLPHASPQVPGVLPWRGQAVAVYDLASLVAPERALRPGTQRPRTLVVQTDSCTLAMPVDAVREVQDIGDERIRPPHVTHLSYCPAEADILGAPVPVLDLQALVAALLALESDDN
jgi:chemotaxis signal transduction protein